MAKKALIEKAKRTLKFKVRQYTRCFNCGRPRSVLRIFQLCRMCFRKFVYQGYISGFRKISW